MSVRSCPDHTFGRRASSNSLPGRTADMWSGWPISGWHGEIWKIWKPKTLLVSTIHRTWQWKIPYSIMEIFTGKHHGSVDRKIIYTWGIFLFHAWLWDGNQETWNIIKIIWYHSNYGALINHNHQWQRRGQSTTWKHHYQSHGVVIIFKRGHDENVWWDETRLVSQ